MGSHPRAIIVLALLLVLLGSSNAQSPPFCTVLNAFVNSPAQPDGLVGSDLTDVSFVAANCAGSSMNYDKTTASTATASFLPSGLSLKDASIRRTVTASVSAAKITFSVSVILSANVVGTYLGGMINTPIVATMKMSADSIPTAAAGSFPVAWVGTLATPSTTTVSFQDADLFDEIAPAVLSVTGSVSPSLLETAGFITTLAGDFNVNLGGLTISHPSLAYPSARGAFIGGVSTIPAAAATAGSLAGTSAGILVQQTATCSGTSCPDTMNDIGKAIVSDSSAGLCDAPTLVLLRSARTVDMFVSPSTVSFRSASGTTEALYKCADKGYVGLQLRVTNSWPAWPVDAFMEDNTTAAYLTKSSSPWLGGYLWGHIAGANSSSYSFVHSDIFGIHGGGRLILDAPFEPAAVTPLMNQLHSHLNTGVAAADAVIDEADDDIAATRDAYLASTINPTWNGFLQYYADRYPGFFRITFGPTVKCGKSPLPCKPSNPVMDFVLTLPSVSIPKTDPLIKSFDSVISGFASQINSAYGTSGPTTPVAGAASASISLFVSYIHRVRINGFPSPTGTYKNTTLLVSDELIPQLYSAASLVASFSGGLFTTINVTLVNSTVGSNTSLVRAKINTPFSTSIGSWVSRDSTGKLIVDQRIVPFLLFQDPLSKAAGMLGEMEFFYTIAPLSINPSSTGNTTYMKLLTSVYDSFSGLTSVSSQSAAQFMEQQLIALVGPTPAGSFTPRISIQSTSALEIDMRFVSLQMVIVSSNQLLGRIDVSELTIPAVVYTRLLVQLKTDGSDPTVVFELKVAANYSDFTLPISFSMNAAVCTSSDIGVVISLPDGTGFMDMKVSARTDLNATVNLEFTSEKLGDFSSSPSFLIYGEEQVQSDPLRVFSDLKSLFLLPDANLGGALKVPFYPWGDSFSSHMKYGDIVEKQIPWLTGPTFTITPPAQTGELCLSDLPSSITGNFTVNAHDAVECTIGVVTVNYDTVVASMNAGLAACGLSTYVTAVSVPAPGTDGCMKFPLQPQVPGVLYQFATESNLWKGTWSLSPFAEFTSWPELPVIVGAVIPQATISPVRIFTAPSAAFPSFVETSLRPVFPKLTVVEYSVKMNYATDATSVNSSRTATTADAFTIDLQNGVGEATIAMGYAATVRSVMDLPVAAVCVSSNFTSVDVDQTGTTVPNAPFNQLALSLTAMIRTPAKAELVTWEGKLTLTPNMALTAALAKAVADQPEGTWLEGLLNASRYAGDKTLGIPDQVRVCLNQQKLASGGYIIPLEMAVMDAGSPFFPLQSLAPPNSINTAIANITIDASLDASATAVNTSVGVIPFTTSTPVTGTSTIHATIKSSVPGAGAVYQGIGKLFNAAQKTGTILSSWALTVDTDLTWNVKDIVLQVDSSPVGISSVTLTTHGAKSINTTEKLQGVNDISLTPAYSSPAVGRLAKMAPNPFCDGISTILRLSEGIMNTAMAKKQWPFMKFSAAPVFGSTIKTLAGQLASRVCKTKGLTIASFCSLVKDVAGFPMCSSSTVDSSSLVVLLQFVAPPVTNHPLFVYDFAGYGPSSLQSSGATMATGMDANFDLVTKPTGTIEFLMELAPGPQPPSFILGERTAFQLTTEGDFGGELSARLGPARVTFTGVSGGIDLVMDVQLTDDFKGRDIAGPGTETIHITEEPVRGRKLAIRQGKTGLPVQISFTGSSSFSAAMLRGLTAFCDVQTSIPSIANFFSQGKSAADDNTQCNGGVEEAIDNVKSGTSPLDFWGDIGMIQNVIISALRDFLNDVLGPSLAGQVWPLIEDLANYLLEPVLSVISPQNLNKLSHGWLNTIAELQKSDFSGKIKPKGGKASAPKSGMGKKRDVNQIEVAPRQAKGGMSPAPKGGMTSPTPKGGMAPAPAPSGKGGKENPFDIVPSEAEIFAYLKELLPKLFTKLLCDVFGPYITHCPPAPAPGAPVKRWLLPFRMTKTIPVVKSDVVLGDHGFASLEWDCSIKLILSWNFTLMISYSEADGLDLTFPTNPVLQAEAKFVTVPGCTLEGKMLVVGFSFKPTGVFDAKMTVNKDFNVNVNILARLTGDADIGFAGPIAKALTGDPDAITALPHIHASIVFSWAWTLNKPNLATPKFNILEPQLCLGTYINGIVGGLAKQVKKIIDPLAPIIGPDGILLKKIEVAKYIIGRETNLLEILGWVAEYFCSIDECTMEGVVDAIKVAVEVYKMADILGSLATDDPNGCGIVQMIQDFDLDFLESKPMPKLTGKKPPGGVTMKDPNMASHEDEFNSYFNAVQKGDFAFNLDILDDPVGKLLTIMLGGRVPIASFTLPAFQIGIGAEWRFLIWTPPLVYIVIGLSAGISVDIGKIALLSDGVINAITTGDVGQIVAGLAMPTKEPNGKPHYPLKAFVKISAGVEVSILIFKGGAQVWLRLDGAMGFSSVNGDDWITFAEIWNLFKYNDWNIIAAFDKTLEMTAGIYLYIKACIPLIFTDFCFTVISIDLKFTIFKETWKGNHPPPIADGNGRVKLGSVKKGKGKGRDSADPLVALYPNSASGGRATTYSEDAVTTFPPIARDTPNAPVNFDETAQDPFTLYLHGMDEPVVAPSGQPFTMQMDTRSYVGLATHSITPSFISPSISITDCTELTYDTLPPLTTVVYTDGAPCPSAHSSVSSAQFYIKGTPDGYSGKPITIKDAVMSVDFNVPTTTVMIASNHIYGAPDLNVNMPPPVLFLTVTGHPVDATTYTIADSAEGSLLKLTGGAGSDIFVTKLSDNKGTVTIDGAAQGPYANWMQFTVDADAGNNITLTPYASTQEHMGTGAKYTVHHSNTPRRSYNVNAVANERLYVQVSTLETNGMVDIHTRGATGAVIAHELLSCNDQSELRVYVNGPGQHLVIIGDGTNTLANFGMCTVRVLATSEAGQDARIILNQGADANPLRHLFNVNSYSVRDPTGSYLFSVTFTGIDFIILNAGLQSEVTHQAGTLGTETIIHFPDNLAADEQTNSATIENWTNAIVVNGSFVNITVGLPADPDYSVDPFTGAGAVLAINAQVPDTEIFLVSGQDQPAHAAPAQRYQMSNRCFDPLDLTLTKAPKLTNFPTAAMLNELLVYNQFDPAVDYTVCHVAYRGPVHFVVRTGAAADWFNATGPAAPVNFSFYGGDDIGIWSFSTLGSFFNVDMGEGRDKLMLGLPVGGDINAVLGDEMQVDSVDIYPGVLPNPSISTDPTTFTAEIVPIGREGEVLRLYDYHPPYDLAHIRQGPMAAAITNADTSKRDGVVYINAASPGEVLKVDLQTGQSYVLQSCGQDTTVVLDPEGPNPDSPPAAIFDITIDLPSYTQSCYILVPSVAASESSISVMYKGANTPNGPNFPATMTEMSAFPGTVWTTFGGTRIQSTFIDHFYLNFPETLRVNLTVDGTAGADISVVAPAGSWVNSGDSRFASNALIVGPSIDVSGPSQSGNLIISANAITVALGSPASSSTIFKSGSVSFTPPVTPLGVFTPWFVKQVGDAGLTAGLSTSINVYITGATNVVIDSNLVTASGVGQSVKTGGLFQVIGGDLALSEVSSFASASINSVLMTVTTVASNAYRLQIDPGQTATITTTFVTASTLSVACAGVQQPQHWIFAGSSVSTFDFVTTACAGTIVNQSPLPTVTINQPGSIVSLTSTLPVDAAPFTLSVAAVGDNTAYTTNFFVTGAGSKRTHSVSIKAANSTLASTMTVTGVGAAPVSTATLTAASTTLTNAIATTFGVVSSKALNVSAIGSLSVNSVALNVTGDILPFDFELATVAAPGSLLSFNVGSVGGTAGFVNVTATGTLNSLNMDIGVSGVAQPPTIALIGTVSSPNLRLNVSGDVSTLDIDAVASASSASTLGVFYNIFGDTGANDLITSLVASNNEQSVSLGLTGDLLGNARVRFGGSMDTTATAFTINGDISPLAVLMNVTGDQSNLDFNVNIVDDSSAPLVFGLSATSTAMNTLFNITGDNFLNASSIGLTGFVGVDRFVVSAVGNIAPLNVDIDMFDGKDGSLNSYFSVVDPTVSSSVPTMNMTVDADLNTINVSMTIHGFSVGSAELGFVGTVSVRDINFSVIGDMGQLVNELRIVSDNTTADLVLSVDQNAPRDLNVTTTIVEPSPMDLTVQLIGDSFGQRIIFQGELGQRTVDVNILGTTNIDLSLVSVDDRLALAADGASSRHPVDIDVLGKILPLDLKLEMSNDNMNLAVEGINDHTASVQVVVPDPDTPGLYWNLMGSNADMLITLDVFAASTRTPLINIGGSLTPQDTRLKVYGDIVLLDNTFSVETSSGLFGVDVGIIGQGTTRDFNVTVDNTAESALSLDLSIVGAQGPRAQLISVTGTMGQRTVDIKLKGQTPMLVGVLSRDNTLSILTNATHPQRERSSPTQDLTVNVNGKILPLDLTFGLVDGDDLTVNVVSPANHTLNVLVSVPDQVTPGLIYSLAGDNRNVNLGINILHSTRNPMFNVAGLIMPIATDYKILGDISTLNSSLAVDTGAGTAGKIGVQISVIGPSSNTRDLNVTVDSTYTDFSKFTAIVVGQQSQSISVIGNMGERQLNVLFNGPTPMLVSLLSRDSSLSLMTDGNVYTVDRDLLLGVTATILPLELAMTVTGDTMDLGVVSNAASTSTFNVTMVSSDPNRALTSVLYGDNSALDLEMTIVGASSGNPTVSLSGGYTTTMSTLNVTGGGVSQLAIDLDVLGVTGQPSEFDLALAPLAAKTRVISVQPQPITADTDQHRFITLDLALITKKTFDLKLVDANTTLYMNTDSVVPTVFVGGSAVLLLNNTDEFSAISFPGRRLVPAWPRDALRPMLANGNDDCLQPLPDCTREGWIRTAVVDTLSCPNRTCSRIGVILTTPFDIQCPANGQFPDNEYVVLVNPSDATIKSPYSPWTFYFAVVILAFCWLVPLAIWTVFGYLYWNLWAEFVICAMTLFAQPHTHPLALSLIQNFNHGVSTAFLFNCFDLHNLSIVSWTGIAACAAIVALFTIEKLGNPRYKMMIKGVIIAQRFFGGWLFFFFAPIALANIWTCGVGIGTRLFFPLALVALHIIHRILVRLRAKQVHVTLWVTIPVAAFTPLVLVGWSFGLHNADVSFSIAVCSIIIISIPHFIKSWFWRENKDAQFPWVPAVTILSVVFGLVFVALIYARGPSAAIIAFLLLWAVSAVAATVVGRVMAYLNPRGQRVHAARHPAENMRSPLLADNDPSL